jgi:deazaflavin-dependent oxidoreductase (nitroreductase family)
MSDPDRSSSKDKGSPPPRWLLKTVTRLHVLLHRVTGGRFFNRLAGDEVCFVTMKGARSGREITIPLMYVPHEGGVLLVASQGGAPKNPTWYHNLVKNPEIRVRHRDEQMQLRARLARPDEKPQLWPICDRHYAPYADYRKRTDRDIPIFVCEPAG